MKISICMPYARGGAKTRDTLIMPWLVQYYRCNMPDCEVIVGDGEITDAWSINRSKMRNDIAKRATGDVLAFVDADAVVSPQSLREAAKLALEHPLARWKAVRWVNVFGTAAICEGDYSWARALAESERNCKCTSQGWKLLCDFQLIGLVMVVSRNVFNAVGGFDERFIGWGEEDSAFVEAISGMFGSEGVRVDEIALHLEHERLPEHSTAVRTFKANCVLRNNYKHNQTPVGIKQLRIHALADSGIRHIAVFATGTPDKFKAGAENTIFNLALELSSRGHAVHVLSRTEEPQTKRLLLGIPIYSLDYEQAVLAMCDYVIGHHGMVPRAIRAAKHYGLPCAIYLHNGDKCWRQYIEEADLVMVNSALSCEQLGVRSEKIVIIEPVLHRLMIGESAHDKPRFDVLTIGLSQEKGAKIIYDLAAKLPHVTFFTVYGAYGDQIYEFRYNMNQVPTFLAPFLKAELYNAAKIVLVPSPSETFGRVAYEAALLGKHVIASNIPAHRALFGDSVRLFGETEYAQAILDVLEGKLDQRAIMTEQARSIELHAKSQIARLAGNISSCNIRISSARLSALPVSPRVASGIDIVIPYRATPEKQAALRNTIDAINTHAVGMRYCWIAGDGAQDICAEFPWCGNILREKRRNRFLDAFENVLIAVKLGMTTSRFVIFYDDIVLLQQFDLANYKAKPFCHIKHAPQRFESDWYGALVQLKKYAQRHKVKWLFDGNHVPLDVTVADVLRAAEEITPWLEGNRPILWRSVCKRLVGGTLETQPDIKLRDGTKEKFSWAYSV